MAKLAKHGVDVAVVAEFDFETAKTWTDTREIYGEVRTIAAGFIANCLHVLVFTVRGRKLRIISLRKVNRKAIAKKVPPIMPKNKRPRQVSAKDWDAVDSLGAVAAFKAQGCGCQTRMAAVLKKHAKQA